MIIPKNTYHFSVDDVFDALIEVSDQKIPLFKHPFFFFLKKINSEFGAKIGLHLFYQKKIKGKIRTLREVESVKKEIEENPWLFFGPHALDYETPPYTQSVNEQIETFEKIYKEIDRFAGKKVYTNYVRLQYYSESFELGSYFKEKNVNALFTTDREVGSHRMPRIIGNQLLEKGYTKYKGMDFVRTHFRVEFFAKEKIGKQEVINRFKKTVQKYGFIIFYTHEVDMKKIAERKMAELMFEATQKLNLFSFDKP